MNRKKLVWAGVLGLACLFGGVDKVRAVGTETVNSIALRGIQKTHVSGFTATIWNGYSHGTTAAYFNAYNQVGTTAAALAGSTTIANGSIETSNIYDQKVICIGYASITDNGTPTFKIYGLNGTTTTGTLAPITRTVSNQISPNPWIPTTAAGTSATFLVSEYYERMAVSVECATGGTTTAIYCNLTGINEND